MKCIIPGINIKVFGRAIHSLSKIGDEIYIEPLEHGLALRTVNSSRSAYGCFMFSPTFFQHYDDGSGEIRTEDSEDDTVRCKVAMKSCLTVFKSMPNIEKTVERCKIKLDMADCRLVFQLYCKHGIVKTHNLAFIECETLQAVFSKDMSPNQLTAQAKLLADAVVNFQTNQEEITLFVTPEKVSLKNYVDDEPDPNKVMHTVVHLDPDEFDNCHIGVDTDITFCLKELRAILGFAEVLNMPMNINFESAGRPVVFGINSDTAFEANLVLATLADAQTQISNSQQHQPTSSAKAKQRKFGQTSKVTKMPSQKRCLTQLASERQKVGKNNSAITAFFNRDSTRQKTTTKTAVRSRPKTTERGDNTSNRNGMDSRIDRTNKIDRSERLEAAYDAMMDDDFDEEMVISDMPTIHDRTVSNNRNDTNNVPSNNGDARLHNRNTNSINDKTHSSDNIDNSVKTEETEKKKRTLFNMHSNENRFGTRSPQPSTSHAGGWLNKSTHMVSADDETQDTQSPVIPNQSKSFDTSAMDTTVQEEDDDDDFVPGTPPSKKFRSLFFGMSQGSTNSQVSQPTKPKPAVLVEDSDED